MDLGEFEAAGLYDATANDARARRDLLEYLTSVGCTIAEMTAAHERGRLFALAGDRLVIPGRDQFSLSDIATRTGADVATISSIWRALGFVDSPLDEPVAAAADVAAIETVVDMATLLGLPGVLGICRVVAASLARIGEAASSAVRAQVPSLSIEGAGSEAETARSFAGVAEFVPRMGAALDALFRHHLESARMNWERSDSLDLADSGGVRVGVGFADLSGFTGLTETLSLPELSSLLTVFEEVADDVVRAHSGRVVKYIGDAVMYVTNDATSAVAVAQGLLAAAEIRGMRARAGVAVGTVLSLEGDYFGPVVNLAARLAAMAEAGEVLLTAAVAERLSESLETVALGVREIRGFTQAIEVARLR